MSTKYLARTVIEGGRCHSNQYDRYHSNRAARARMRHALTILRREDAAWADGWAEPVRQHVGKGFSDKLGPARRWLMSRAGNPWVEVFHELIETFDPRTIAGQHIVFDHMLPWVDRGEFTPEWARQPELYVDEEGILQARQVPRRRRRGWIRDRLALADWLAGRRVAECGARRFWLLATTVWRRVNGVPTAVPTGRFRQDRALTPDEERRWLGFSEAARKAALSAGG